jgi:hypothetical protein
MRKKVRWSKSLAYAIGLLTTDGNLSPDGRHINLTSKDLDQIQTFARILKLKNKVGFKKSTYNPSGTYYNFQFGHINLYKFLLRIGLTPNKSLSLGKLFIPDKYFIDFFRGCLDGDGNISLAEHPESQHYQLRVRIASGSFHFLNWLKDASTRNFKLTGGFRYSKSRTPYLIFAKEDSLKLLAKIYPSDVKYYLVRKFITYQNFIRASGGMVDTRRLGRRSRKRVEVQVLSRPHIDS